VERWWAETNCPHETARLSIHLTSAKSSFRSSCNQPIKADSFSVQFSNPSFRFLSCCYMVVIYWVVLVWCYVVARDLSMLQSCCWRGFQTGSQLLAYLACCYEVDRPFWVVPAFKNSKMQHSKTHWFFKSQTPFNLTQHLKKVSKKRRIFTVVTFVHIKVNIKMKIQF